MRHFRFLPINIARMTIRTPTAPTACPTTGGPGRYRPAWVTDVGKITAHIAHFSWTIRCRQQQHYQRSGTRRGERTFGCENRATYRCESQSSGLSAASGRRSFVSPASRPAPVPVSLLAVIARGIRPDRWAGKAGSDQSRCEGVAISGPLGRSPPLLLHHAAACCGGRIERGREGVHVPRHRLALRAADVFS